MDSRQVIHGRYYPHIDGIRTIAVTPVVLYHIFAAMCPGGYVGVDIFFVISGYLITKGILGQLAAGKFTIAGFYERRIRRIIPAYLVLIAFVLLVSVVIYGNAMVARVAGTTAYSTAFSANIYFFLKTGGYWDASAETNPLLHLWSLGVEEQFYIFTPLALSLIYKVRRQWVLASILVVAVVSLALSIGYNAWGTPTAERFNFYLLPTRTWELLAGSLLAYFATVKSSRGWVVRQLHAWTAGPKSWLGLVGMVLCLGTCYAYNDGTLFPGAAALPPVVGAMLMIRYGATGWAGRVLCSKLFVGIGKISYSLYLWHWPLIVFWRYITDDSINPWGLACVFVASVGLAWASWRFVEMPVRLAKNWNLKRALAWVVIGCGFIGCASVFLVKTGGGVGYINAQNTLREPYWLGEAQTQLTTPIFPLQANDITNAYNKASFVFLGADENPTYLLLGDSHAMALAPGFHCVSKNININGVYASRQIPILNRYPENNPNADEMLISTLAWLDQETKITHVILGGDWNNLGTETTVSNPTSNMEAVLADTCKRLKTSGKKVILVADVPRYNTDVPELFSKWMKLKWLGARHPKGMPYKEFVMQQGKANSILRRIEEKGLAQVLWVEGFFYDTPLPKSTAKIVSHEGHLYYTDFQHLSPSGGKELMQHYEEQLKQMLAPPTDDSATK